MRPQARLRSNEAPRARRWKNRPRPPPPDEEISHGRRTDRSPPGTDPVDHRRRVGMAADRGRRARVRTAADVRPGPDRGAPDGHRPPDDRAAAPGDRPAAQVGGTVAAGDLADPAAGPQPDRRSGGTDRDQGQQRLPEAADRDPAYGDQHPGLAGPRSF